jgi:hypothetical protein
MAVSIMTTIGAAALATTGFLVKNKDQVIKILTDLFGGKGPRPPAPPPTMVGAQRYRIDIDPNDYRLEWVQMEQFIGSDPNGYQIWTPVGPPTWRYRQQ